MGAEAAAQREEEVALLLRNKGALHSIHTFRSSHAGGFGGA